jgi:ATP-dependent Clp protease ATP-binding subunit ClpC
VFKPNLKIYSEKARRVIFFARYEASEFGRDQIEADLLLLGIAREDPDVCIRWLGANYLELREKVAWFYTVGEKIATNGDLPFSNQAKRVLAHAAEEAKRLANRHIGLEHLFLGLLHEEDTASKILKARGEDLASVRAVIAEEAQYSEAKPADAFSTSVKTRIVTENGSDLAIVTLHGRLPGLGEAISVSDRKGVEATYRIRDVNWRIRTTATACRVAEILLTVRKEKLQP